MRQVRHIADRRLVVPLRTPDRNEPAAAAERGDQLRARRPAHAAQRRRDRRRPLQMQLACRLPGKGELARGRLFNGLPTDDRRARTQELVSIVAPGQRHRSEGACQLLHSSPTRAVVVAAVGREDLDAARPAVRDADSETRGAVEADAIDAAVHRKCLQLGEERREDDDLVAGGIREDTIGGVSRGKAVRSRFRSWMFRAPRALHALGTLGTGKSTTVRRHSHGR